MSTARRPRQRSESRTAEAPTNTNGSREKRAAQIARAIEGEARSRGWPTRELLGSEAELMERYDASRALLREAVRLVEHNQVATMQRGPNGGLFLRAPEAKPAATAAAVYLEYVGTTVGDLLRARLILEPVAASLAANRIDDDGIAKVRQLVAVEAEVDGERVSRNDSDRLHLLVAELSGNPALVLLIEILATLTANYVSAVPKAKVTAADVRAISLSAHDAIADAVVAGNASLAESRMIKHLLGLAEWFDAQRLKTFSARRRMAANAAPGKLAEAVARDISLDIARAGWQVGSVVGSEAELVERHQVSRAVLREAVRILEHHSVARMRRGPGGGLVVAEPQPSASIDAMALYLDRQQIDSTHLRTVLAAIELACVEIVAAKASDPAIATGLRDALAELSVDTPGDELAARSNLLHRRICELAENPVLTLFLNIMTAVWSRHSMAPTGRKPDAELARPVVCAHEAIVEALLAGDAALARHRMRRHLDAMTEWWH